MEYNKTLERFDNKIQPLVYASNCSGTSTIDKSQTIENDVWPVRVQDAYAQKFIPTSKCLESIKLRLANGSTGFNEGAIVQIRRDSGGVPTGNPDDTQYLGQYIVPREELISSYKTIIIPLNIELQDSDLVNGVWIVITSGIYDPDFIIEPSDYLRISASTSGSGLLGKISNGPWISISPGSLFYQTYKQTYTPPIVCPNPAVVLTIPT